jgi:hypothetical protein
MSLIRPRKLKISESDDSVSNRHAASKALHAKTAPPARILS